jgi:hypothetical protein
VEVNRSERVWTGTVAHPPSLCAVFPCWTDWSSTGCDDVTADI